MDKVRKALDLARLERQQQAADGPRGIERPASGSIRTGPIGKIAYTFTRVIPVSLDHLEARRIVVPGTVGAAAAAFRMLRTQVLQRMTAQKWQTLAVFSPTSGDGRTTVAINLAIAIASDPDYTVLLVDLDLRRPGIANAIGFAPEGGVGEVLSGNARVEECLYHPDALDRLVVLPARDPISHSSEILSGTRCRELVGELRSRYERRIVIFDLPPVLNTDDALAFAPHVECGLAVAAEGKTRREDLVRSLELLRDVPIVGTALNHAGTA